MKIFQSIGDSFSIVMDSLKSIKKYPILLFPIFITWLCIAGIAVYLHYYFIFPEVLWQVLLICFGIFWAITFILSFSCAMMVELVRQIETDGKVSLQEAFLSSSGNIVKLLWISCIWAVVWFILFIIEVLLSKDKEKRSRQSPNPENIAKTLGWAWSRFSWLGLWVDTLKRIMRMTIFLSIPAMMWKKKWVFWSLWQWIHTIRKHPWEFLWVFASVAVVGILMALPLAIIFWFSEEGTTFPNYVWIWIIIYEGIIYTFSMYLEQMTAALLYLWHINWQKAQKIPGSEDIHIHDIPRPSLIDDIREFSKED